MKVLTSEEIKAYEKWFVLTHFNEIKDVETPFIMQQFYRDLDVNVTHLDNGHWVMILVHNDMSRELKRMIVDPKSYFEIKEILHYYLKIAIKDYE